MQRCAARLIEFATFEQHPGQAWNDGVNLLRGDEFEVLDTVLRSTPSWSRQVSSAKMVVASLGS
jgi:hypothetical protein